MGLVEVCPAPARPFLACGFSLAALLGLVTGAAGGAAERHDARQVPAVHGVVL